MSHLINMTEQIKKLKNGVGIQNLLDSAYRILGNPIAMFNTEYSLLAYTEVTTDDPIWNELVTYGSFSNETRKVFESEGFIEDLANAARYTFMVSDKIKYDRICGKIFNKNASYVSNLVIVACNKPFSEDDPMIFDAVCKLVSREVSRNEFYQEYEQSHQESIIKHLIDGNYDVKLDLAQVEILYDSLASRLYIAVADVSHRIPEDLDITYLRNLFKQARPAYKYAVYNGNIVIIISTNDDALNVRKELNGLLEIFEQKNIYAGISSGFENLFELSRYYTEALHMMRFVAKRRCSQRVFPFCEGSVEKMKRIEALSNGNGIQYFLDIGPGIFGNPLLFHDMELNLLAYSQDCEISDPIWEELITYGTSSDETINLFKTTGFVSIMENTKGGALLISDRIKYDRISWRIYSNDNIMIGCLSIVNSISPFTEDELVLFGAFSQRFSKEVGKIEFYSKYGQVYSGTVINRLISGKIDNYGFYSEDIGNLYDNFMDNMYLVVVDTSQCDSKQINLTYIRDLFNWPGTMNRYAIHDDYIIIILSIESAAPLAESELFKINAVFGQNNIYAGMSSRFEDIYELCEHYNEAVDALNHGIAHKDTLHNRRIFKRGEAEF